MNLPPDTYRALLKSVDLLKSSEAEGVLGPEIARQLEELVSTVQAGIGQGQVQVASRELHWPNVSALMSAQDQKALCQVLESILRAAPAPKPKPSTSLAIASAMQRFERDLELFKEVLEVFLQHAPILLSKVRRAIADENPQQVAELAHELRGSAANVGAESIRAVAERLEFDTKEASLPHMLSGLESLEHELQRLCSVVTDLCGTGTSR